MSGANNSTFNLRPLIENKLNAHNFLQWEKAMRIVLRAEGKENVLENPLPLEPLPENATEAQCRAKQTLQDNSLQVTCLMLACMEPEYQKRFDGLDAYTIIQQLKTLFQKNARLGRLHSMMVQDEGNLPGEPEHKDVLMVKRGKQFKSINVIEVNLATTTSWVFDTACGSHIIGNVQGLKRSRSLSKGEVDLRVGNGARVAALAVGDYSLRLPSGLILELYNCYYVPVITKNIISIPILDSEGFSFQIMNNCCSAYLNGMFYVSAKLSNGLYVLDLQNHIYHIENKKHKPNDLNPTYLWHSAVVRKISARWEVELAEAAAAVRYGLMIAKGLSLNNIMVECDASNVVRSLKSRSEGLSPFMLVHDDNNRLRDDFESFSCFHRIRIAIKI
ncbi:uncharacterized protein [Spinacia oleracea]|uniref:RNase H type-1 domain-containing protein n=1 Tax=Spinacia oleracea TaxID=3562 RepID=A0ABM3R352_SPIOL|nr:uncharacterized protein LOC130464928 [Spinacia oleracea]